MTELYLTDVLLLFSLNDIWPVKVPPLPAPIVLNNPKCSCGKKMVRSKGDWNTALPT